MISGNIEKMSKKHKTKIRRGKDRKMNGQTTNLNKFNTPTIDQKGLIGFRGTVNLGANTPVVTAAPAPSFWETDIQVVKSCGVIGEAIQVSISSKARHKINALMNHFPGTEWLAYLVGNKDFRYVEDIVIPKQRVTSVNVYVDDGVSVPIMGVIHSHHDMGNSFSHTDDTYINQNHDISLCISNNGIKGHVRVKTECGRFALVDAKVVDHITEFVTSEFIKEIDALITKQTFTYSPYYGVGRGGRVPMVGLDADEMMSLADMNEGVEYSHYGRNLRIQHHITDEVMSYEQSIRGTMVDAYYSVEFDMLAGLIESIGSHSYDMWEDRALNDNGNVYTEDYYRLVDEISTFSDELTELELVTLNKLALSLRKRLETNA